MFVRTLAVRLCTFGRCSLAVAKDPFVAGIARARAGRLYLSGIANAPIAIRTRKVAERNKDGRQSNRFATLG